MPLDVNRKQRAPPWRRQITQVGLRLLKLYGPFDREAAEKVARALTAVLVPRRRPGRKPTKVVLRASELREQGWPWKQIYVEVFPDWETWDFATRSTKKWNLRRAVVARRKRLGQGTTREAGR